MLPATTPACHPANVEGPVTEANTWSLGRAISILDTIGAAPARSGLDTPLMNVV
jgi:hypothetical protein